MTIQSLILVSMLILSVLIIVVVILQPSQRTGLMGDATDIEKREKRGVALVLFRMTVILIILFFGLALTYSVLAPDAVTTTAAIM